MGRTCTPPQITRERSSCPHDPGSSASPAPSSSRLTSVSGVFASSHREAPLIGGDPAADNTDLYAFVSPDDPTKLTIIANYIPLQQPGGGPNFHPFDDAVRYQIHIDNTGDGKDDVTYTFRFKTQPAVRARSGVSSFLYNNGPITTVNDATWLAPQTYNVVERTKARSARSLGNDLRTVPANIGPRSHPDYATLAAGGVHGCRTAPRLFAGPRDDAFFVDLGSIFDLGGLRPFNDAARDPARRRARRRRRRGLQHRLDRDPGPARREVRTDRPRQPVVGVWASASRQASTKTIDSNGTVKWSGPWVQVSRLGNPLINEVIIPRHLKDYWNGQAPSNDSSSPSTTRRRSSPASSTSCTPPSMTRTRPVAPTSR